MSQIGRDTSSVRSFAVERSPLRLKLYAFVSPVRDGRRALPYANPELSARFGVTMFRGRAVHALEG